MNWTPSIGWQQSFLILLVVALSGHYFWQKQTVINSAPVELSLAKLDSSALDMPRRFDDLNYAEVESAFADLQFEKELLVLDANTELQFSIALEHLPDGFEHKYLDRIDFLIQQQFDDNQSQQVLSLLKKMADYKKQETAWFEKDSVADNADENVDKFNSLFDLQDRLLGKELAQKFYSEQRRLMRYMIASFAIEKDESLSEKQRQDALEALANTLEQPK